MKGLNAKEKFKKKKKNLTNLDIAIRLEAAYENNVHNVSPNNSSFFSQSSFCMDHMIAKSLVTDRSIGRK